VGGGKKKGEDARKDLRTLGTVVMNCRGDVEAPTPSTPPAPSAIPIPAIPAIPSAPEPWGVSSLECSQGDQVSLIFIILQHRPATCG